MIIFKIKKKSDFIAILLIVYCFLITWAYSFQGRNLPVTEKDTILHYLQGEYKKVTPCSFGWYFSKMFKLLHKIFVQLLNNQIYICTMYRSAWRSSSASWCSNCLHNQAPSTSSTSASLYPVSPPDNTFTLPTEVFSSCLAIVSAVTVGGLFLWPALRYGTGYQTVWETWPSAETPSDVHWRRFYFQLTCVHSALELSGRCALQIYLLTYLHFTTMFCRNTFENDKIMLF